MNGTPPVLIDHLRMSDWAHLRSSFTWIYEGGIPEPYKAMRFHHPGLSALLVLQGTLTVESPGGSIQAGREHWVFPKHGPRLQTFSDDARVLSLHFNLCWPGGQPLFDVDPAFVMDSAATPILEKRARTLLRTVDRQFPGARNDLPYTYGSLKAHMALQKGFNVWLGAYVDMFLENQIVPSRLGQVDPRVLKAVTLLDELPVNVEFDGSWLSNEVNLSHSQLDRLFIKQFGVSPRQYLDKRKLEQAMELMRCSSMAVKQIAYEVGFHSLPCFSRWFRQKTGISPRDFQKSRVLDEIR